MKFTLRFASLFFFWSLSSHAQKITTLEINLPVSATGMEIPVSMDLKGITSDSLFTLVAVDGNKRTPLPFQISKGNPRVLHWRIKTDGESPKRTFELLKTKPSKFQNIEATMKEGELTIHKESQNLLRYTYKTVYPPAGVDTAFKRSAFIHPVWTPHGQLITRIQPPDHYHHYGIWDPWTHTLFEGDTLDFWNIKGRKGTVRFKKFVSVVNGPVYSEFAAIHEHVAFKKNGIEKVALNELQTVRVYRPENEEYYFMDITIELKCASESPFRILEYRYGGLGWRGTEKWNKDNSEVLTSESKTRKNADGSTAKWFWIQGALDNDFGGAVWMSHPSNYNHPEPLRVWPEDSNRGEMFVMFAPTKTKDWLLEPGKTYTLKYRFIVFNGHFQKEKAESAWQYFATPPQVIVRQ